MKLSTIAGPARAAALTFGAVLAVAAGPAATNALAASPGPVYAWGSGNYGALGDGTVNNSFAPVPSFTPRSIVAVSEGFGNGFALTADGQVLDWGNNNFGDLGVGSSGNYLTALQEVPGLPPVHAIASGADHTLALLDDGTVRAWGYDVDGELGDGAPNPGSSTPVVVQAVGGGGELRSVAAVAAGYDQSLALLSDGSVVGWGLNSYGQVGDGSQHSDTIPVPVKGVGGAGTLGSVKAIAAGYVHSLALLDGGTVVSWGFGSDGELGDGENPAESLAPVPVSGIGGTGTLSNVVAVAGGAGNSTALLSDGTVLAWGADNAGQLGQGSVGAQSDVPVVVKGLSHVVAIAETYTDTYALKADGTVWAWGDDNFAELGDGGAANSNSCHCAATPVEVGSGFGSVAVLATGASAYHELAILGPRVAVSTSNLSFGTQPQSTLGPPQTVTVTNQGRAPLAISGLSFAGADPGDFVTGASTCGGSVAPGASCVVQVSFAPQASGARAATLQIASNDLESPATVSLSGTGGALPQGATGPAGALGPAGPVGPAGATGPQGPAGQVELVTCTQKKVKQGKHTKTVTKCSGRLMSGTLSLTAAMVTVKRAQLVRGHVVYASGAVAVGARGTTRLTLQAVRALRPGSYTLTVRTRRGGRITTTRTEIELAR